MDCPFCKITVKELDAKIISETETTIAFLDINPVLPGHSLVIPKAHYINVSDAPAGILADLMAHAKETANLLVKALDAAGFNIVNANGKSAQQSVFHLHFHIVPRFVNDGKNIWFHGERTGGKNIEQVYAKILRYQE